MAWFNEEHPAVKIEKIGDEPRFIPWKPSDVKCFLCGVKVNLKQPGIYWSGMFAYIGELGEELTEGGDVIFFHPNCAIQFAAHISKDSLLSEYKEHRYRNTNNPPPKNTPIDTDKNTRLNK